MVAESSYPGEFILSEAPRTRSRETIIIAASQTVLAGSVLGQISLGTLAVAAAKTGTGNGAITGATVAAGSQLGVYVATCVAAATNAGTFVFQSPTGEELGSIAVGVAFTLGGITATIADGSADWVAGDEVRYTVTAGANAAAGQYVLLNPSATDGSQVPAAIAFAPVTTGGSATAKINAIVRAAEVKSGMLNWGSLSAGQITTATAQLVSLLGIHPR